MKVRTAILACLAVGMAATSIGRVRAAAVAGRAPGWLIRVWSRTAGGYAVNEQGRFERAVAARDEQVSPDGASALVLRFRDGSLSVARGRGPARHLTRRRASEARWAGNHAIVFVSPVGDRPQAFRIDSDGRGLTRLTDEPDGVRCAHLTAEGRLAYLVLASTAGITPETDFAERIDRLRRVDLVVKDGSGRRQLVAGEHIHETALSGDGRLICYEAESRLVFLDVASGRSVREMRLRDIDPRLVDGYGTAFLSWRPDGEAVLFRTMFTGGRSMDHALEFGDTACVVARLDGTASVFAVEPDARVGWMPRD